MDLADLNYFSRKRVAGALIAADCVKLSLTNYFTFSSGLKSPIYVDARNLLAHPNEWNIVILELIARSRLFDFDTLVGIASGGIPHAALMSSILRCPMAYVNKTEKKYGLAKQIEGSELYYRDVLIIDDVVTTGASFTRCAEVVNEHNANVAGMLAIINYRTGDKVTPKVECLTSVGAIFDLMRRQEKISNHDYIELLIWLRNQTETTA